METYILYDILLTIAMAPLVPIVMNILNLVRRRKIKTGIANVIMLDILFITYLYMFAEMPEWDTPLFQGENAFHTPLASPYAYTILLLLLLSITGYLILYFRLKKLSPILKVLSLSAVYAGIILNVIWIIQLASNVYIPEPSSYVERFQPIIIFLLLFPINFIIASITLIVETIQEESKELSEQQISDTVIFCNNILGKSLSLPVAALVLLIPFLGICLILTILLGQQSDSAIKAFTETSDWYFSTKVSPPPVPYQGHYLCSVAAGGHPKIVKPLRPGLRWGHPIIVNRQLCVANAFEDLISEKTPRFHQFIRHQYDKHGYPLAEKIQTPLAADITYILMKPLEWLFLAVLYSFDTKPEDRIARQYLPTTLQNSKKETL